MPIRFFSVALAGCLVAFASYAAVVIPSVAYLNRDANVQKMTKVASAIAAATVIYDRCDDVYHFTDDQKQRLRVRFDRTTKAYLQAYRDAYSSQVGVLPDQKTVDGYRKMVTDTYQASADKIASFIAYKDGCKTSPVQSVLGFVDRLEQAADAQAEKEAETPPTP